MPRLAPHRLVRSVAIAALALVGAAASATPASAGGWAVGSLDAMPDPVAGDTVEVGFTILQHGVTPVDLTEDVGIEIVAPGGGVELFPAAGDGTPGHYVADVTFPATSGTYTWGIRMGWFAPQDLGALDVTASPTDTDGASAWSAARWLMIALTAVLATVAIADLGLARRRRRVALG